MSELNKDQFAELMSCLVEISNNLRVIAKALLLNHQENVTYDDVRELEKELDWEGEE